MRLNKASNFSAPYCEKRWNRDSGTEKIPTPLHLSYLFAQKIDLEMSTTHIKSLSFLFSEAILERFSKVTFENHLALSEISNGSCHF